jgi:hypothetical protein
MPPHPQAIRVNIIIDIYDEPLLTTLIWARRSAHQLTSRLWDHGVLAHVATVEINPTPSTP